MFFQKKEGDGGEADDGAWNGPTGRRQESERLLSEKEAGKVSAVFDAGRSASVSGG